MLRTNVKTKTTILRRVLMLALAVMMVVSVIIPSTIHAEAYPNWKYEEFYAKFKDVEPGHWGVDYLITAETYGVLKGYPDGTMKPDRPVTYAECIAMMVRASGCTIIDENVNSAVTDRLPAWVKTHWAANEIKTAFAWSWIDLDLIADKTMIDTAANRVFATTMWGRIDRFFIMRWNYNNVDKSKLKFSDCEKLNDEQKTCIQMLVEANIIDGFPDGTFKPNDSLTRVQVAKIITIAKGWSN